MRHKLLLSIFILLLSTAARAESISITIKPEKSLSGTTSLTIHNDGNVTVLVYESAVKITESTINLEPKDKETLRLNALSSIAGYLNQERYNTLKGYTFTTSLAHTVEGVTKNISSKRLNEEAIQLIKQLIKIVPNNSLQHVKEEI